MLGYGSMDLWYASAVIGGAAIAVLVGWGWQRE